jgi:hypothetical protein
MALATISQAMAQQNQTPGDMTAGGTSQPESSAASAQAGANTTDGTTTGSSGPKEPESGPPGDLELPPLPSAKLCDSYEGAVRGACLLTATNESPAGNGAQQ